jgi:hypothetical protein
MKKCRLSCFTILTSIVFPLFLFEFQFLSALWQESWTASVEYVGNSRFYFTDRTWVCPMVFWYVLFWNWIRRIHPPFLPKWSINRSSRLRLLRTHLCLVFLLLSVFVLLFFISLLLLTPFHVHDLFSQLPWVKSPSFRAWSLTVLQCSSWSS